MLCMQLRKKEAIVLKFQIVNHILIVIRIIDKLHELRLRIFLVLIRQFLH